MLGILFFGIIAGILIGVVLSLLLLIARSSQTSVRPLGRKPASDVFHALGDQDDLQTTPGIVVVRIDGPLFFADADRFRELARGDGVPTTAVIVDVERAGVIEALGAGNLHANVDAAVQAATPGTPFEVDGARR